MIENLLRRISFKILFKKKMCKKYICNALANRMPHIAANGIPQKRDKTWYDASLQNLEQNY